MLENFRRIVKRYHTLTIKLYDQMGGNEDALLRSLAYFYDNRRLRENPVRLDQLFVDAEVYEWRTGPIAAQDFERVPWTVPMRGWAAAVPFDEVDTERPGVQYKVEQIMRMLPEAFMRKRIDLIASIFETNPIAYTGQDFFSGAHPKPHGQGTFSNTFNFELSPNPSDPAALDEAIYAFINQMYDAFTNAFHLKQRWVEVGQVANLLLIVPTESLANAFRRVRDEPKLRRGNGTEFENGLRGRFRLFRAMFGQSPVHTYGLWDVPNGPKATVFALDKDPWVDAETGEKFGYSRLAAVMKSIFAVKPLFPHAAQRAVTASLG